MVSLNLKDVNCRFINRAIKIAIRKPMKKVAHYTRTNVLNNTAATLLFNENLSRRVLCIAVDQKL